MHLRLLLLLLALPLANAFEWHPRGETAENDNRGFGVCGPLYGVVQNAVPAVLFPGVIPPKETQSQACFRGLGLGGCVVTPGNGQVVRDTLGDLYVPSPDATYCLAPCARGDTRDSIHGTKLREEWVSVCDVSDLPALGVMNDLPVP